MASICVQSETNFQGSKIECFDLPDYELQPSNPGQITRKQEEMLRCDWSVDGQH